MKEQKKNNKGENVNLYKWKIRILQPVWSDKNNMKAKREKKSEWMSIVINEL